MFIRYALRVALFLSGFMLVGCATLPESVSANNSARKPSSSVVLPAQNMPALQTICDQLQAQFQTQLPAPILHLMRWQVSLIKNPLNGETVPVPACQISLSTDGATIERLGLTPQFMVATLERLDWQQNQVTQQYTANSATGGRLVMMQDHTTAVLDYDYAPEKNICPLSQPIAACKIARKQWLYRLSVTVLA
jgi:hypothetical protein